MTNKSFVHKSIRRTPANLCFYEASIEPAPKDWMERKFHKVCVVDVETTGLHAETDEIIELGLITLAINPENFAIEGYIDKYQAYSQPSKPIAQEITEITGIDDKTVAGQSIDWGYVSSLLDNVELCIARNATFDRPFLNKASKAFDGLIWGCSMLDVPWKKQGLAGISLKMISYEFGYVYYGHRALNDAEQTAIVLNVPLRHQSCAMKCVWEAAHKTTYQIYAVNAPYSMKDVLKDAGYRWNSKPTDNKPKAWYKVTQDEDSLRQDYRYLEEHGITPFVLHKLPTERFSA